MQDRSSTPEQVSLRQAVLWVALGLEPCEERFEALEGYPRTVDRDDPQHPLSDAQKGKIKTAKRLLGRQLIEGGLAAYGRPMTYELTDITQEMLASGMPFEQLDPDALDRVPVAIPAEFWRFDAIGWDEGWPGSTGTPGFGEMVTYLEVRIRTDELRRAFPVPLSKARQQGTGGRKPVHDQLEIMMLAVWDAASNDLPAKQSAWVERIALLLDLHYEDRAGQEAPQRTLLQELGSCLYALRDRYEQLRRKSLAAED
jgi:hypothetical protein